MRSPIPHATVRALCLAGLLVPAVDAQLTQVATRPPLPDDPITLEPWLVDGGAVSVDVWAGLVGENGFKAGMLSNEHATGFAGSGSAGGPGGEQVGKELLLNGKDLWGELGTPVDLLCSTILKPGKVLVLLDTGYIVEVFGIWGNGGVVKPKSVVAYDLGLPADVGQPTAFAEGLRGFASFIDGATPLIAIGTDAGYFGFAGFEHGKFGFENPIISFDNPIISFDNPIIANAKGFDEPALSTLR